MERTFNNYMNGRRPITVKIYDDHITFHFKNEGNREFYHIPKEEWISDKVNRQDREDNWHAHMMRKTWFCSNMRDFINENTEP